MNITIELEKLISLRDKGDLSDDEFKKAKAKLLSEGPESTDNTSSTTTKEQSLKSIPGMGLAIGVFLGNFLIVSITSGQVVKGFIVGLIAAVLVIIVYSCIGMIKKD